MEHALIAARDPQRLINVWPMGLGSQPRWLGPSELSASIGYLIPLFVNSKDRELRIGLPACFELYRFAELFERPLLQVIQRGGLQRCMERNQIDKRFEFLPTQFEGPNCTVAARRARFPQQVSEETFGELGMLDAFADKVLNLIGIAPFPKPEHKHQG